MTMLIQRRYHCCSIEAIECENDAWRARFEGREYGQRQDAVEPGKNSTWANRNGLARMMVKKLIFFVETSRAQ